MITIDTEETGLWSGQFQSIYNEVDHIRAIHRLQEILDRYDVKPSYLIDYPIASKKESANIIRVIFERGKCEIGAHMHPWCCPPFSETLTNKNSYFCYLNEDLQEKKLTSLTEAIKENFGFVPQVFRAGRFGFEERQAKLLRKFGYLVDSSVRAFSDFSFEEGPDFSCKNCSPYWIEEDNKQDISNKVLEVPVSVGFNRNNFEFWNNILKKVGTNYFLKKFHMIGILDRLSIVRKIVASPEHEDLERLKNLAICMEKEGMSVTNIYFHSSSLKPGGSPYVRSEEELEIFLTKIDKYLHFMIHTLGFKNVTLMGYREKLIKGAK